jgi:hypothetical protein
MKDDNDIEAGSSKRVDSSQVGNGSPVPRSPLSVRSRLLPSGEAGQLTSAQMRKSYADASYKMLTDTPLYFNTFMKMVMRWSLLQNTTPWQQLGKGVDVEFNAAYLTVGVLGAVVLAGTTLKTFARFIRKNKMHGPDEGTAGPCEKVFDGTAALYKAVVKVGSIGLWVFTLYCKHQNITKKNLVAADYTSAIGAMAFFAVGVFASEFSIFTKKPAASELTNKHYWAKRAWIGYCALSSGLGTALAYFTSIDGYLKHIQLAGDNVSAYMGAGGLRGVGAVAFVSFFSVNTLSLLVSTMRMVAYKVGVNCYDKRVANWRASCPNVSKKEIAWSAADKSFVSASSGSALIFTLTLAVQKAATGSVNLIAPLLANVVTLGVLTYKTYKSQHSGLMPDYLVTNRFGAG